MTIKDLGTYLERFALKPLRDDPAAAAEGAPSPFSERYARARRRGSVWQRLAAPTPEQRTILAFVAAEMALAVVAAQFAIGRLLVYPFAIISTIFHEFGHAATCVLTGGRVKQIIIAVDESGETRFTGGLQCLVLPAGYIGSTAIGVSLLFAGFDARAARYTAIGVIAVLFLTIIFSASFFTFFSAIGLIALLVWAFSHEGGAYCRHVVLLLGSIASIQSLGSILNGTVFNTIPESDAYKFATHCSILIPAAFYGLLWMAISLLLILAALAAAVSFF